MFRVPRSTVIVVWALLGSRVPAQENAARKVTPPDSARAAAALAFRTIGAVRIKGAPPVLDGRLDDAAWQGVPVASDFTEQNPVPGILAARRTEVRIVYDDRALYFGIRAYEEHPEWIVAPFPRRDDETRSDWIFVEIDSRHDRRSGFGFGVNPRGVQVDATFDQFMGYDNAWNGVWEAVPRIDSLGWAVEYRIPFSQLAYARRGNAPLSFGLNVYRRAVRAGQSSDWSPRLPTYSDLVSHFNDVTGIALSTASDRLELVPYSAAKTTSAPHAPGDPFSDGRRAGGSVGADFRYRLTPGFTLTGAIHPDFGQVEADPSQVNLTTYETFFPEQRPFFVEGATQFDFPMGLTFASRGNSFASEQPFYTRRIGGPPHGSVPADAGFSDVPTGTTVLGAAKLSGRTANGWSVGALGAVTGSADARYVDALGVEQRTPVDPTTETGVLRISRQSDDGRRAIGGIATALNRSDMSPALEDVATARAFALGASGRLRSRNDLWEVSGLLLGSYLAGAAPAVEKVLHGPGHFFQRPDASYLHDDPTRTSIGGAAGQLKLWKVGGVFKGGVTGYVVSPGFELNDLGFQRNADWAIATGWLNYERFRPGRFIRRWAVGSNQIGAGWSFGGERRATVADGYLNFTLRNYWGGSLTLGHEWSALSLEELRGGPALLLPPRTSLAASLSTDSRRPFQVLFTGTQAFEPATGSHQFDLAPSVTWRTTDRLALSLGPEYARTVNGWQYVGQPGEAADPDRLHYVLARLEQSTAALTARVDYAFSPRMTLQLYAQPFVSAGRYTEFKEVEDPRAPRSQDRLRVFAPSQVVLDPASGQYRIDTNGDGSADVTLSNPDFNTRSFNANVVFRWEYRPGSALYLVWTQRREGASSDGALRLGRDLTRLFNAPATNVLLVKASFRLVK